MNTLSYNPTRRTALTVVAALSIASLLFVALAYAGFDAHSLDALQKLGFKKAGFVANALQPLFDLIAANVTGAIAASFLAVASVVALMFWLGHSRAVDVLMKVGGVIAFLLVLPALSA